jgi:hypothetical protein
MAASSLFSSTLTSIVALACPCFPWVTRNRTSCLLGNGRKRATQVSAGAGGDLNYNPLLHRSAFSDGEEWELITDADGDTFFRHRVTGELRWERPTMALPRSVELHHAVLEARSASRKAESAAALSRTRAMAASAAAAGSLARTIGAHAEAHTAERRVLHAARAVSVLRAAVLHKPHFADASLAPPSPREARVEALRGAVEAAREEASSADRRVAQLFASPLGPP